MRKYYGVVIVWYTLLTFLSLQIPFFCDNVGLVSRLANFYYDTDLTTLILPTKWDSGHPPFYGFFMAVIWKIFGKSLAVSHLVVLPFLISMGILYTKLAAYFLDKKYLPYALCLLFLEPTLLAQSVLGGFDIVIVTAHLLAIYALLKERRYVLSMAFLVLGMMSYRGIIAIILLGISDVLLLVVRLAKQKNAWTLSWIWTIIQRISTYTILAYLPIIGVLTVWFWYHYQSAGFLFFNHKATWATTYQLVDWKGFLWNTAIIIWRFLDFGRLAIWLLLSYLFMIWIRKPITITKKQKELFIFCIVPIFCYIPFVAYRTIPIVHRYFLVYFLLIGIFVLSYLPLLQKKVSQKIWMGCIMISLISGHFWVYPNPIAKGWDSFLAFLPYFELKEKMAAYVQQEGIPHNQIATESPANICTKFTHLTNDTIHWQDKEDKSFVNNEYIIQSNVMNNYTDNELDSLDNHWILRKEFRAYQVYIRLYENPVLLKK